MKSSSTNPHFRFLVTYFGLTYLLNLYLCTNFVSTTGLSDPLSWLFVIAVTVTYPVVYMSPPIVLTLLLRRFVCSEFTLVKAITLGAIIMANVLITMVLYSDVRLYDLYGFHVNAFVINLLVTPGGIQSLGASGQTYASALLAVSAIFGLHIAAFYTAIYTSHLLRISRRMYLTLLFIFITTALSERMVFGISDSQQYAPVLKAARTIPLYNQVTFRSFARKLGFDVKPRQDIRLEESANKLHYPLAELTGSPPASALNIIWIVSESMRWDMLAPDIMPNTYAESEKGWRFTRHYSGGNGTRQGLFSLFYGIYGCYWDTFLMEHRSPAFVDLLQNRGYQLEMFTSADFTYPEFDRTLFSKIPDAQLHQFDKDLSAWRRDEANTHKIIDSIRNRDESSPFMIFMFYESTHARYDFPQDMAIRKPYLEDLNYATMTRNSLAPRIDELKNRYINASNFIDSQLGKLYSVLTEESLWQNTIVMVTGDHGEEFMENGFWGHNSGFSEQQIRTPMVLWIPGTNPRIVNAVTSHMDIIPTIMPLLGVNNPTEDYSLGVNLSESVNRPYLVVSDWAGIAYLGDGYKFTLPLNSSLGSTNELFSDSDEPMTDFVPFLSSHKSDLDMILHNAKRFTGD